MPVFDKNRNPLYPHDYVRFTNGNGKLNTTQIIACLCDNQILCDSRYGMFTLNAETTKKIK